MPKERKLDNSARKKYITIRRNFEKPVIGITGMLGKTSIIKMLSTILTTKGNLLSHPHGSGNWNNNIQSLEHLESSYDYAIFEFDYNRGNDFAELLRLIKPNIGIVTNIGDAHLTYLGHMIKVALEKSAVVKYLARDGVAILNKDDELSSALADYISTKNIVKYGLSNGCNFQATDIEFRGPEGITFKLNAKTKINGSVAGSGDIYYKGDAQIDMKVAGSGSIKKI